MATNTEPFSRLTGTLDVYIAPNTGTAEAAPDVDEAPAGNWVALGPTEGDQEIAYEGGLTFFYDNSHQGAVKSTRPQEDPMVRFTVVGLTLENFGYILSAVGDVSTAAGPPAIKTLNIKRGSSPTEYSLLLRGSASSPYGNFPGQWYVPKCVQAGEPVVTFAKDGSPGLACEFHVLEDSDQSAGAEMGNLTVQTA